MAESEVDKWLPLKRLESYQVQAWQNRENGKVLSLEQKGPDHYDVVTLPENFRQDNQVIEVVEEGVSYEKAIGAAEGFKKNA